LQGYCFASFLYEFFHLLKMHFKVY